MDKTVEKSMKSIKISKIDKKSIKSIKINKSIKKNKINKIDKNQQKINKWINVGPSPSIKVLDTPSQFDHDFNQTA